MNDILFENLEMLQEAELQWNNFMKEIIISEEIINAISNIDTNTYPILEENPFLIKFSIISEGFVVNTSTQKLSNIFIIFTAILNANKRPSL